MSRTGPAGALGNRTEPGGDSASSWDGAGSGADSASSWDGAGSGADSASSWDGAGSGADSASSWDGAGSGADSVTNDWSEARVDPLAALLKQRGGQTGKYQTVLSRAT